MKTRPMVTGDYEAAYQLWASTPGIHLSEADSREQVLRYLERNPGLSMVSEDEDGTLAGTVMCGHDGRRGYIYHVAVSEEYRGRGVGRQLVSCSLEGLRKEGIGKCHLMVMESNGLGRDFWSGIGWQERDGIVLFSQRA